MLNVIRTCGLLLAVATLIGAQTARSQPGFGDVPTVDVSAAASAVQVAPGGQVAVAVVLDHGDVLHSWPSADQDVLPAEIAEFAIRTAIELEQAEWVAAVGPVQWPEPKLAPVPNIAGTGPPTVEVLTYKGRAIAYVPVLIADDAAEGVVTLPILVQLQACDDTTCYIPQFENLSVELTITSSPASSSPGEDFAGFDASVFASLAPTGPPPSGQSHSRQSQSGESQPGEASHDDTAAGESASAAAGPKFLGFIGLPSSDSPWFFAALIAAGALGGFVLNLTPCVLPVIPIKVLTLTQHAGASKGQALLLGTAMAAGVVAFWTALAIPVVALASFADPSQLFGIWWVTFGIGALIFVMSFGLIGMFNISLPQKAYMINPKADSPSGSFMFGVMTAVLGLPCFGFIVGALLPAAAASGASQLATFAVFVSMGVGMALPYFILSLRPQLLSRVPKTGPASDLVKQVMALLLMAAGAYFIGAGLLALAAEKPFIGGVLHWWAVAILVVAAGFWLVLRTVQISKSLPARGIMLLAAVLLSAGGLWVADNQTGTAEEKYLAKLAAQEVLLGSGNRYVTAAWNDYDVDVVQAAVESGNVVVMDFTAEWCLICKSLKASVLDVEPVKPVLLGEGVVPITVDLTARSAPGWEKLRELGQTGIPTLAVFGPGLPDGPWISNAYTPGQVLDAIERARGDGPAVSPAVGDASGVAMGG